MIRRAGLLDQPPERISAAMQGRRLAGTIRAAGDEVPLRELQRMVALLASMARLTTSSRFETASTRPEARSHGNIQRLARAPAAGGYDARRPVPVGFSDGEGAAESNRKIAMSRAEAVRDAVPGAASQPRVEAWLRWTASALHGVPSRARPGTSTPRHGGPGSGPGRVSPSKSEPL